MWSPWDTVVGNLSYDVASWAPFKVNTWAWPLSERLVRPFRADSHLFSWRFPNTTVLCNESILWCWIAVCILHCTSNSVEEPSREHHQEIPWGLPTLENLGRCKTRSAKLPSAGSFMWCCTCRHLSESTESKS